MRTRICLYVLLLAPLVVFWQTVFQDYAHRADYLNLAEAHDQSGKLVRSSAAEGRPLGGAMLETSFLAAGEVENLQWLRLCTVLLLTLLGLVLWRQLYQSGWNEVEAAGVGLGTVLLPSSQVLAGTAAYWPQVVTLLLAVAGFSAIETEVERGGMKRFVALLGGCLIYVAAGLIHQPSVLFALVLMAAVLLARTGREPLRDLWWCTIHIAVVLAGLALSYLLMESFFAQGIFQPSTAIPAMGAQVADALVRELPNGLALYALNDDHHVGAGFYWGAVVLVLGIIGLAYRKVTTAEDPLAKGRWTFILILAPLTAVVVGLVAAEPAGVYRAGFAVAGLVLVLVVASFRVFITGAKVRPILHHLGLGLLCAALAFAAHYHSYRLLTEPQVAEWGLIRNAVLRGNFNKEVRAHVTLASDSDRPTERLYADEFGAISSDQPEIARAMFAAAVRSRYPEKLPKGGSFTVNAAPTEPEAGAADLVVDLRKVKTAH